MTTEKKIIDLLDGKYQYDEVEYFDLEIKDRDMIAHTIVKEYFWQMEFDEQARLFYLEFVQYRIQQLIKEEKYEAVDLYQRLEKEINLQNY
jgi:hypothetical protein